MSDSTALRELPDLLDFLEALHQANAQYLIIGGHAVGLHGHSRATKDLDVWIGTSKTNRAAVLDALVSFGAPARITRTLESATIDDVVFLGRPPFRIDLMQRIPGISDFDQAYARRVEMLIDDAPVHVMGLNDLLTAKRASGRPQDLADVDRLERLWPRSP